MRFSKFYIIIAAMALFIGSSCNFSKTKKNYSSKIDARHINDEELLDLVQHQTFNYFWEGAEPNSGLARERLHMDDLYPTSPKYTVTTGGSGFGLMAILVGVERGFITREQALERFEKIVLFLENADRFHGAWPHWINGETGKVIAFGKKDNGGDLVETAFLVQGLLTVKQYFQEDNSREINLRGKIQKLWEDVEWSWFTKGNQDVLYWHWSPNYGWDMNFPVGGYNECLIMYVLAAASPTYPITKSVYEKGWAKNGEISKGTTFYGLETVLNHYEYNTAPVGPLFWAHYSYLGLNPKGLKDQYADYWKLNRNHALIYYRHSIENPHNYKGYGENSWGMTSSYSMDGYAGHTPSNDLGVISPTAAISSIPYTPKESMQFIRHLYTKQDSLIGKYGPYDAYSEEKNWVLPRYLAIDQGPIPVMIENYRTGLIWKLFMQNEDVQIGLKKLNFTSQYIN